MTSPDKVDVEGLRAIAEKATPGPWHHVNPGRVLPKTRTIHGPVPAARVDYVSTWPDVGTPPGHRVVVPMPNEGPGVRSDDMAFIAAFDPPTVLALLDALLAERSARERAEKERDELTKALTGLTCGGSEFFLRDGDRFKADIHACVGWVRRAKEDAHRRTVEAIMRARAAEQKLVEVAISTPGLGPGLGRVSDHD